MRNIEFTKNIMFKLLHDPTLTNLLKYLWRAGLPQAIVLKYNYEMRTKIIVILLCSFLAT